MKQQIEKIQALLVRGGYAAAEHELEVLAEMYEKHLKTVEASDRIKNGNIEQLTKDLKDAAFEVCALRAEIDQYQDGNDILNAMIDGLQKERDALLAERDNSCTNNISPFWP